MLYPELPVSSLQNANMVWARSDMGPMDELVADIKKHGVNRPVLVAPDYSMLDGARRLLAAAQLKQIYVPVVVCHTWEKFVENYAANTTVGAYPMTWLEIRDLIDRVLRPLYQEHRYRMANATRDHRKATGEPPPDPRIREYNYSHFIVSMSELLQAQPAHVKMLNDSVRRLYKLKQADPKAFGVLATAIQSMEPRHRRDLSHIRVLKTTLDRVERGATDFNDAGAFLLARIDVNGAPRYDRVKKNVLDPRAPVVPLAVIRNFAEMLSHLMEQADGFRNFKLNTQHQKSEFTDAFEIVVRGTSQLYRLRRRMESALPATTLPGDNDKEPADE